MTISLWSHALAAILYGALALWQGRHARPTLRQNALVLAFGLTACWALRIAFDGSAAALAGEGARDIGWLVFMFLLLRQAEKDAQRRLAVSALYAVVALLAAADLVIPLLPITGLGEAPTLLRLMGAIGALVLAHNLYTAAEDATAIRLPIVALATMWLFDLNIYTLALLDLDAAADWARWRGLLLVALAPLFALAAARAADWKIGLSRKVAFQSLSLLALGGYVALLVGVTYALNALGPGYARIAQVGFVVVTTLGLVVLLPFDRVRGWAKLKLAKHLFQHRYDYRAEWVRFTATLSRADDVPLDERAIRAIADISDSPGGLLLAPDDSGALIELARWNWPGVDAPVRAPANVMPAYDGEPRVIELDTVRGGGGRPREVADWMLETPQAWALVPLVHVERLAGVVLLARPAVDRVLDWEDFDLLRVAGRQVASYLAEARGQEILSDARRFDEFNRRFAFILHDVKNLCSQLTLVARNAEKHSENPEFRADMIETLKESATKMNGLLARLSQHNKASVEEPRPVAIGDFVAALATAKRGSHPIRVGGELDLHALADPTRLEQLLGHLIQNAIDASGFEEPVALIVSRRGVDVAVEVVDNGPGMDGEFIRAQLFRPFFSTKPGGFGIGAYEARALAQAMGGRIEVESRVGEGSRFTLILPQAEAPQQEQAA